MEQVIIKKLPHHDESSLQECNITYKGRNYTGWYMSCEGVYYSDGLNIDELDGITTLPNFKKRITQEVAKLTH